MLRKHQGNAHNKPYTVPPKLVLLSDLLLLKAADKYPVLNHCFKEMVTVDSGGKYPRVMKYLKILSLSSTSVATLQDNLESKTYF